MKNKNKQLVLTLTLSSLLLVGCAANSETKTDPLPAISAKLDVDDGRQVYDVEFYDAN